MIDLSGLNAVVTGCAGGIGSAISAARAEAGAIVVGVDMPEGAEAAWKERTGGAAYRRLDVTSEADWAAFAGRLEAEHGRLDILVDNAGVVVEKLVQDTTT